MTWVRQINVERENIRAALAFAIDADNAALAVKLVASHPHRQAMSGISDGRGAASTGISSARSTWSQGASRSTRAFSLSRRINRYTTATTTADTNSAGRQPKPKHSSTTPLPGPRIEMDIWILRLPLCYGLAHTRKARVCYAQAAEIADSEGYPGIAAMLLSYSVNTDLLGGSKANEVVAKAEEAVSLHGRLGCPRR